MPELTHEHVEDLFNDLRAAELHQVRPPGAAVAHATVRRRRTTASVTAGVVFAVTGVAAAGAAGLVPTRDPDSQADHATLGEQALVLLTETAGAAISNGVVRPVNPELTGKWALNNSFRRLDDVVAGTYQVRMACVGVGSTNVVISGRSHVNDASDAGPAEHVALPCARQGVVMFINVVVPAADYLQIETNPDRAAVGRSAFAYEAALSSADERRLTEDADAALTKGTYERNALRRTAVFIKAGITDDRPISAGSYRLEVACTGTGSISGELETAPGEPAGRFEAAPCGDDQKTLLTLPFTKEGDKAMRLKIQPEGGALGQSAVAYRIVPD